MDITDGLAGVGGKSSHDRDRLDRDDHHGMVIHFVHVPTGETCHFKAFLTEFNDQYASEWNAEKTFGRMDPISTFERTGRVITLAWDAPSASEQEAIINLREAEKLISMLYPVFEERDTRQGQIATSRGYADAAEDIINGLLVDEDGTPLGSAERNAAEIIRSRAQQEITSARQTKATKAVSAVMVAPPLMKLKFSNLIMDPEHGSFLDDAVTSGLLGTVAGLSYKPDLNSGFFGSGGELIDPESLLAGRHGILVPQTLQFSIEFTVHHTHKVGFRRRQRDRSGHGAHKVSNRVSTTQNFPYSSRKAAKSKSERRQISQEEYDRRFGGR